MSKMICVELTHEAALEAAAVLANRNVEYPGESEVHTGTHPEWGDVHIVIPMMGSPLRLKNGSVYNNDTNLKPVVVSNFDKLKEE